MKILLLIFIAVVVVILLRMYRGSTSKGAAPSSATIDQLPAIVSKLEQTGRDDSFVVFLFRIPGNNDEVLPNLQYSIENGNLGFDWVLEAPQNLKDETALTDFIKQQGHKISSIERNEVKYLRVEGRGIADLGVKVLRDFYRLTPEAKLKLIIEGFDAGN